MATPSRGVARGGRPSGGPLVSCLEFNFGIKIFNDQDRVTVSEQKINSSLFRQFEIFQKSTKYASKCIWRMIQCLFGITVIQPGLDFVSSQG